MAELPLFGGSRSRPRRKREVMVNPPPDSRKLLVGAMAELPLFGGSRSRPRRKREAMANPPPDELRCSRNGGNGWRCPNARRDDHPLCNYHYEYRRSKQTGKRHDGGGRRKKPVRELNDGAAIRSGREKLADLREYQEPKKKMQDTAYLRKGKAKSVRRRDSDPELGEVISKMYKKIYDRVKKQKRNNNRSRGACLEGTELREEDLSLEGTMPGEVATSLERTVKRKKQRL